MGLVDFIKASSEVYLYKDIVFNKDTVFNKDILLLLRCVSLVASAFAGSSS